MTVIAADELCYTYPGSAGPALSSVSFRVDAGELVLALGPSGGGKSTLLRSVTGLVPQFYGGSYSGRLSVRGLNPATTPVRHMAAFAGLVFQEPESQAIADTVDEDVAFGLEQRNVSRPEMERRLTRCLEICGIAHLRGRRLSTLSGGERQRAAIAAILALGPDILLMDEPSAQLDPRGAQQVFDVVHRLRREEGTTVIVAEHRLEKLLPMADRVLSVSGGRVESRAPDCGAELQGAPAVCALGIRLGLAPVPLDTAAAVRAIHSTGRRPRVEPLPAGPAPGAKLLTANGISVAFGDHEALRDVSLRVREGEIVAVAGPNGSGKSTLLRAFAGTVRPHAGVILFEGRGAPDGIPARTAFAGLCPQDPGAILRRDTVAEEIGATLQARHQNREPTRVLGDWNLARLAKRDPRDISTGERERVATAAMLAHDPPVWLLDEPTRGADRNAKSWLAARLRAHADRGGCAVVATHDVESAARFASRVVGLEDGQIAFDLPVRDALGSSGPLPTQVATIVEGALLPEEVSW